MKYEGIMKENGVNMKKYVALGTRRAKHRAKRGASRHLNISFCIKTLGIEKIPSFPHIGSKTRKSKAQSKARGELSCVSFSLNKDPGTHMGSGPLYSLWDLKG